MKILRGFLIAAVLIVAATAHVHADEPPAWDTHFTVYSESEKYKASVTPLGEGAGGGEAEAGVAGGVVMDPWELSYELVVRDVSEAGEGVVLWRIDYFHSGYNTDLYISNDGRYVVYVEFWYYPDGPLVTLYGEGGKKLWYSKDLDLDGSALPRSVSHRLWLESFDGFIYGKGGEAVGLKLKTLQGERKVEFR